MIYSRMLRGLFWKEMSDLCAGNLAFPSISEVHLQKIVCRFLVPLNIGAILGGHISPGQEEIPNWSKKQWTERYPRGNSYPNEGAEGKYLSTQNGGAILGVEVRTGGEADMPSKWK